MVDAQLGEFTVCAADPGQQDKMTSRLVNAAAIRLGLAASETHRDRSNDEF